MSDDGVGKQYHGGAMRSCGFLFLSLAFWTGCLDSAPPGDEGEAEEGEGEADEGERSGTTADDCGTSHYDCAADEVCGQHDNSYGCGCVGARRTCALEGDGCTIDITSDPANCGDCGRACATGVCSIAVGYVTTYGGDFGNGHCGCVDGADCNSLEMCFAGQCFEELNSQAAPFGVQLGEDSVDFTQFGPNAHPLVACAGAIDAATAPILCVLVVGVADVDPVVGEVDDNDFFTHSVASSAVCPDTATRLGDCTWTRADACDLDRLASLTCE